jgi:transposase
LQIHLPVGAVVDPVVLPTEPEEPTTVTPAEIIYQRRVRVLDHARRTGNVAEACRVFGISRKTFYEWRNVAELYGLDALWPKDRRRPQQPNETPTWIVVELLGIAAVEPTIGCRQYADRLAERGYRIGKTAVQEILVDHGLGRRHQRVARAAAITAATTGLLTEAAAEDEPFGFCHYSPDPGGLVALDSFYIGNLKGVGKVYQLTAVDTATRWAMVLIVLGTPTTTTTIRFLDQVIRRWRRHGHTVRAVLTDNGPEYAGGRAFRDAVLAKGLVQVRIPPRSPNHNAVCERFQGTALQECWRPAFHRRRFTSVRQLQAEIDAWLIRYHHRRRNHSDYMRGRTPAQMLSIHRDRKAA